MKTRVFEYRKKPLICNDCQDYDLTKSRCSKESRCGKCGENGQVSVSCRSTRSKCFHCRKEHAGGHRSCSEFRYQEEILALQSREHVNYSQAKALFDRINRNYKTMNFAKAVKEDDRIRNRRTSRQEEENSNGETEVVCIVIIYPFPFNIYVLIICP